MRSYLELMRPGNVVTALADVLAGFAVAGLANPPVLAWLLVATACLYAGGVVLNDFFDRRLDAVERPERPIPSGRVPGVHALVLGLGFLLCGVLAAIVVNGEATRVAVTTALLVVIYDVWGKRQPVIGPVNMGLCRGFNLLLGMAAVPGVVAGHWWLAAVPIVYVAGITSLSRGEVTGGARPSAVVSAGLVSVSVAAVFAIALAASSRTGEGPSILAVACAVLLAWRVLPPFWKATKEPDAPTIRRAIRTGILSLVLIDATIAGAHAGMIYTLTVLATSALAGALAREFAVT
jgi:4-hydroxybenzoate polyprenyltransferase